ncbi:MAG TPA: hypothetical protein VG147_06830 [Solirubrobacteraceae bacterium]|nr:hypothetical protein [Solirubrobacteraceae bacterium]
MKVRAARHSGLLDPRGTRIGSSQRGGVCEKLTGGASWTSVPSGVSAVIAAGSRNWLAGVLPASLGSTVPSEATNMPVRARLTLTR